MKRSNRWFWTGMMMLLVALLVAGCSSEGGGGGGGQEPGVPATITLSAINMSVAIDGVITITATVTDSKGNPVADATLVSLSDAKSLVTITPASQETIEGKATFVIRGLTAGIANLIAEAGAAISTITINVVDTAPQITLSAVNTTVTVGRTTVITAAVAESNGDPVADDTEIHFIVSDTTRAELDEYDPVTLDGQTAVVFTAKQAGTVTVSATYGTGTGTIDMTVADVSVNPPASITLTTSAASVLMGNPATITATVRDGGGQPVADGTAVSFSTTLGALNPVSRTTVNGTATTTFTSNNIGEATITARAGTATGTVIVNVTADIQYMSITTSKASIKTDNNDTATITATLLDDNRVPVEGAPVTFSTTAGQISSADAVTDENGEAIVLFKSGAYDKTNQVATIRAEAPPNRRVSVPVQLTGTKITLTIANTSLQGAPGPSATTLTVTLQDGGGIAIFDQRVTVSQAGAGASVIFETVSNIEETKGTLLTGASVTNSTDVTGKFTVTVTGNNPGVDPVTISAVALGYTATVNVVVSGLPFEFVKEDLPLNPGTYIAEDAVIAAATGSVVTLYVRSPAGNDVQISTTMGVLNGVGPVITVTPVAGIATFTLNTLTNVGVATLMAEDVTDLSINDSLRVGIAAPTSEASKISIQATPTVIPVSSGNLISVADLLITVTNVDDEVVGGALVSLSQQEPTGGGEYISPSLVYTDSLGRATATFHAGYKASTSTGVVCVATLISPPAVSAATDSIAIVIGGAASSVAIGAPTEYEAYSESVYRKPMSVLVSDSNGNPVAGATVNLSVWPLGYYLGYVTQDGPLFWNCATASYWLGGNGTLYPNEDDESALTIHQRNEVLDADEDGGTPCVQTMPAHCNGVLDPAKSTAGNVPATVVTDENGVAEFDYFHQKIYSVWTRVEIRASVTVYGTETIALLHYGPTWLEAEKKFLPASPWGNSWPFCP